MRHRVFGKHLGRTSAHRRALKRNLAASLFEHGTISTTREKAKFVKPFAEKLITLAKDGSLHARRRAIKLLQNRNICTVENNQPVKTTTVIQKLFSEIGPQFADRNGGYTRVIHLPFRRIGDNSRLVLLQLAEEKKSTAATTESPPPATQPEKTSTEQTDETTQTGEDSDTPDKSEEQIPEDKNDNAS